MSRDLNHAKDREFQCPECRAMQPEPGRCGRCPGITLPVGLIATDALGVVVDVAEHDPRAPDHAPDLLDDLRELAASPVSYGQETHGELHADALAHIERCEEAIRKILEGSEAVRHEGMVAAARIYNERRKQSPPSGFDALSDADKAEWVAMILEQRDPDTKACGCGYPQKECLRVVLRNGPPYPPRPCEPVPSR